MTQKEIDAVEVRECLPYTFPFLHPLLSPPAHA